MNIEEDIIAESKVAAENKEYAIIA